jgi:hypothetical protein
MSATDIRSEPMPIGDGFTVTFSFVGGKLDAEWQPRIPVGSSARRRYLSAYKRARLAFVRRVAKRTGLKIMVVDR